MSRYQAYPEYKDSGVEWLGAVPNHWDVVSCRGLVKNKVDKNEGALDQNYLSVMANVGVITYEEKGDVGNKKPDDLSKCKIVKKGNLVINSMNYAIGSYGMSAYDGVCSPVYIVLEPLSEVIESRFALRVFENKPFQKYLSTWPVFAKRFRLVCRVYIYRRHITYSTGAQKQISRIRNNYKLEGLKFCGIGLAVLFSCHRHLVM